MMSPRCAAGALALVAFMVATNACGPRAIPVELADARGAYDRATRTATHAQLAEAKRVLDAAEKMQHEDPGATEVRDLAYAAHRKALVAESQARADALRIRTAAMLPMLPPADREDLATPEQTAIDDRSAKHIVEGLSALGPVTEEPRGSVLTLEASTLFGLNSASLMGSGRERLDLIGKALRRTDGVVTVAGHAAGREGKTTVEKSGELARKRAEAVAAHLRANGLAERRIRVESHEKERARAGDDDRIEIVLSGSP